MARVPRTSPVIIIRGERSKIQASSASDAARTYHSSSAFFLSAVTSLSTDKARNPVNLYAATKLASDKIFIAPNNRSGAALTTSALRMKALGSCDYCSTSPR